MRHLPTRIALSLAMAGSLALAGSAAPARAVFPGTNGKIVYVKTTGSDNEIFTMNQDGSAKTQLTDDPVKESGPVFSADGTKIAFSRMTNASDGELYTMNADGTHTVRLTNNNYGDGEPAWSPDGTKIAFTSRAEDDYEIMIMNSDGTGVTRVTNNAVDDREAVWSPDGTALLFSHTANDGRFDIYRILPNGTNMTRVTDCSGQCVTADWSPSGTQITYTNWHLASKPYTSEVYVANADGTSPSMKTIAGGYYSYPCFSPDGKFLLYAGDPGDLGLDIYRVTLATGSVTRLTDAAVDEFDADWGRA
jgi:Tol biopolymer transport system component